MIVGIFLKNIKSYGRNTFIPLTYKSNFCGLIGKNGIGKSTVLEALDYVLNDVNGDQWNCYYDWKKDSEVKPYVVPIFLIKKDLIKPANQKVFEDYSKLLWDGDETIVHNSNRELFGKFADFRTSLSIHYSKDEYYLIALGKDKDRQISQSIFGSAQKLNPNSASEIWNCIENLYDYIYIPKDIEPEKMTYLQNEELQRVTGQTLEDAISEIFPHSELSKLNAKLKEFTDSISEKLGGEYVFREPSERQSAVRKANLYTLIIEDFFSKRTLHKKLNNKQPVDVAQLSSGEKQQAILDLYYSLIVNARRSNKKLILAIDEPESSLHISACYEQFEKLNDLSLHCAEIIFTSHWYGFIPVIDEGSIVNIFRKKNDSKLVINLYLAGHYRETVQKQHETQYPMDIELKSSNDFEQALLHGTLMDNPYNWILCEGSSDKIYLSWYLKDFIEKKNLRIVPLGGIVENKRCYERLSLMLSDGKIKQDVRGKILFMTDTDENAVRYDVNKQSRNIFGKRLVDLQNDVQLVDADQDSGAPADIESAVNGIVMSKVLMELKSEYSDQLDFIENESINDCSAMYSLDLSKSNEAKLKDFYQIDGMKTRVAKRYVEIINESPNDFFKEPTWIRQIIDIMGLEK